MSDMKAVSTGVCPQCGKGRMVVVEEFPPIPIGQEHLNRCGDNPVFDTS
jgi:hypothetical protein